jgi:hypothetical protein
MASPYRNAEDLTADHLPLMRSVWRAFGGQLVGRTFRFPSHPEHTFTVLARMESGTLEILERGCRRRYIDGADLARAWDLGTLQEVKP